MLNFEEKRIVLDLVSSHALSFVQESATSAATAIRLQTLGA